jgi:acid phosphatase (class A)
MVALLLFTLSLAHAWEIDDGKLAIPPPPEAGSAADKRDFAILKKFQETRTDKECEAAERQSSTTTRNFFGPKTGVLTKEELGEVKEFGDEVINFVAKKTKPFKNEWHRPRPYDEDSEIEPCITKPGGATSYPSGHAAAGVVLGDVLGVVFPEKKKALHEQGLNIGRNRVLGGVHHPTDVDAGRMLGEQIRDALMHDEEFRRDLEKLK